MCSCILKNTLPHDSWEMQLSRKALRAETWSYLLGSIRPKLMLTWDWPEHLWNQRRGTEEDISTRLSFILIGLENVSQISRSIPVDDLRFLPIRSSNFANHLSFSLQ